jgi:hypothetical protein
VACNCGKRRPVKSIPPSEAALGEAGYVLMSYPGRLPIGNFAVKDGTRYIYKRQLYVYKEHEAELKDRGYELA